MKHEDLTSIIIGICIKVHDTLGPGLLESVYESAICYELAKLDIPFERQKDIHVIYDDVDLGKGFRSDILVDQKVMVELKSVEAMSPVFYKTTLTYMKLSAIEVGLLINFNVKQLKEGITRMVMDKKT